MSHVVYSVIDDITSLVIVSHLFWFRLLEGYGGGTREEDDSNVGVEYVDLMLALGNLISDTHSDLE